MKPPASAKPKAKKTAPAKEPAGDDAEVLALPRLKGKMTAKKNVAPQEVGAEAPAAKPKVKKAAKESKLDTNVQMEEGEPEGEDMEDFEGGGSLFDDQPSAGNMTVSALMRPYPCVRLL